MKKKTTTISSILIGDNLGELVEKLDFGEGDARLIVLAVGTDYARMVHSPGISKAELLGTLYLTIDAIALDGRE